MIYCDFIDIEDEGLDLIISFVCLENDYDQTKDILIMRTPNFESFLDQNERGAKLSIGYHDESINILTNIEINKKSKTIAFKGGTIDEVRDCSRLEDKTFREIWKFFEKINFDNSFRIKYILKSQ